MEHELTELIELTQKMQKDISSIKGNVSCMGILLMVAAIVAAASGAILIMTTIGGL